MKVTAQEVIEALTEQFVHNRDYRVALAYRIRANGIAPPEGMVLVPVSDLRNMRGFLHGKSPVSLSGIEFWANVIERWLNGVVPVERRHKWWGAGEADCPKDIKASNGELHTIRCKLCGGSDSSKPCYAAPKGELE